MSPDEIILIAIPVVCVGGGLVNLIAGYIRGVEPGTKRYRSIVDDLRKWRVIEPDEPADSERVRELVRNWARLSRPAMLATLVGVPIYALLAGSLFFGPSSIRLHSMVFTWPVEMTLAVGFYAYLSLVELSVSSRAQVHKSVNAGLPFHSLYTASIRLTARLAVGVALVCLALSLGALTGVFAIADDSSEWVTVRAHPWTTMAIPAMILAMLLFCWFSMRRLSDLRPLHLAEDDMLSLRASVAYLQQQANHLNSWLAYMMFLGAVGQLVLLPDFGTFTYVLMFAVLALLVFAVLQPLAASSMTLPPPELFTSTGHSIAVPDGQI